MDPKRGALMTAFLVGGLFAASLPAGASHNEHDHSENTQQTDAVTLRWPVETRWVLELVFQGGLIVGAVQGGQTGPALPNEIPEGGIALFKKGHDGHLKQVGRLRCKATGEVSIWKNLVLQGSWQSQGAWAGEPMSDCDRSGLRLIDITDVTRPHEVKFIPIPCGVMGHALIPDGRKLYLYAPSTCQEQVEGPQGFGLTNEMTVVRVVPGRPKRSGIATIANIEPMVGCEWVSAIPQRELAACAADNRFILLDTTDPANPQPIAESFRTLDHPIQSLAFSWDGSYVAFGAKLRADVTQGTSATIVNIEDVTNPVTVGTWTVPVGPGQDQQVYSLSFLPMRDGRPVLLFGHSKRGMWLVDFTDPATPKEIAHYVLPRLVWAAYWYNGRFYVADNEARLRAFRIDGFNRNTVHYFGARYNPHTVIADFK